MYPEKFLWRIVRVVCFVLIAIALGCAAGATSKNGDLPIEMLDVNGHPVRFIGGPGPGCDEEIVVLDAPDQDTCDDAPFVWLDHHKGDYEVQAAHIIDVEKGLFGVSARFDVGYQLYCFNITECWVPPDWSR